MTRKQWDEVLEYIDAHLEGAATVADIAAAAGYSAFHFNRMFAARYGISVMAYLRIRRLEHAAARVTRNERILDIALRYGFGSHEAFTRAFSRHYGVPPLRFRAVAAEPYRVPPRPVPMDEGSVHNGKEENKMTIKTETFNDRVLIGYRFETQPGSAEIPVFWQSVMGDERWERLMGKMDPDGLNYGLCLHTSDMPEGRMDYMIAFDYDGKSAVDPDMELYTLKGASYRVFPAANDIHHDGIAATASIRQCWSYIYTEWFPASGLKYDGEKPDFEVYYRDGRAEIFIPIIE